MEGRVVQKLVDNALKSTPKGGSIQAAISVDNNTLVFKIENEGPALPNDLLQWINHYDEENPLSEKRPLKLGLGLLIVQKILHLHHTSLKAYSHNSNNIFSFRIPVHHLPSSHSGSPS